MKPDINGIRNTKIEDTKKSNIIKNLIELLAQKIRSSLKI